MLTKLLLALLLCIHGLIHLLGGLSELHIKEFNNLSDEVLIPVPRGLRKILGAVWLLAVLILVAAAVALLLGLVWWLPLALLGVAISQVLIIIWWPDAKYGTLINILILFGIFLIR